MQSGKLNQWVRFESEAVTRDAIGGAVRTGALVVETWAEVKNVAGTQSDKAGKVTHENTREFIIRPQDMAITPAMRIMWNEGVHRITEIDALKFKGDWLRIVATVDQ